MNDISGTYLYMMSAEFMIMMLNHKSVGKGRPKAVTMFQIKKDKAILYVRM